MLVGTPPEVLHAATCASPYLDLSELRVVVADEVDEVGARLERGSSSAAPAATGFPSRCAPGARERRVTRPGCAVLRLSHECACVSAPLLYH